MENLSDILKRSLTPRSSTEDTGTSPRDDELEDDEDGDCPSRRGKGWLSPDVPLNHPDFRRLVPRRCTEAAPDRARLRHLPLPEGPLYVHFDTDILTSGEVPAQNYPVADGPTAELLGAVFEHLAESGRVVAASLSSWNPDLDRDRASEAICLAVYRRLLG